MKTKGLDRVIVVTDAPRAEEIQLEYIGEKGNRRVRDCGDVRFNSLGELAGTNLTLNYAVKNMIEHTGVSLPEAFRMASLNLARLLKLDRDLGSIDRDKKANLILFSEDLDVVRVLWEGDWI